jgi:hypothetical protein
MKRRQLLLAFAVAPLGIAGLARAAETVVTVYKDPT